MSIRTDTASVAAIIEVDTSIDLTPFITVASSLVDEIVAAGAVYADPNRPTLIETWLSAHFYAMRDPRPSEERAGSVQTAYQSKVNLFLSTSHYGQMAQTLDTSGRLRAISERYILQGSVVWLGSHHHHHHDNCP